MGRWSIVVVLFVMSVFAASCSQTSDISTDAVTTTAPKPAPTDSIDSNADGGSAGIDELQTAIDRLLASNDTCTILTQRDVTNAQLDPTLFTSSSARAVLANGVVQVYDHLIQISPVAIQKPLSDEKAVFSQVLAVVNQYASNPNDQGASKQINTLLQQPGMITAQTQLNNFITQNCA